MIITRRAAIQMGFGAIAAACTSTEPDPRNGHIAVRPAPVTATPQPGLRDLRLEREALLYIPQKASGAFVMMLHGATGAPDRVMHRFADPADEFGVTLLATKSEGVTWDAIHGYPGRDFLFFDKALRAAFAICPVDPKHLAIGGFSDGASYAISLGLANGDLFSHVLAFSPGFMIPLPHVGRPRFFLSHGTEDSILPIDHASRRIARELRAGGYSVTLREFEGDHAVPPEVAREAFGWLRS